MIACAHPLLRSRAVQKVHIASERLSHSHQRSLTRTNRSAAKQQKSCDSRIFIAAEIAEREWELKIRHHGLAIRTDHLLSYPLPAISFHSHPLPSTPSPSTSQPTLTDDKLDFDISTS
ncbi:hypothetical protein BLNAU_16178 [Blattamonas nauphoetae]|uniref:Uncharacterized protein n=1 Tax=Blattamonas nauphoetae TaxID=2049346 RepID=A0ABQ9XF48_9EUKA|nr:hypothetical protein BLNAU_16178 [Blattamonas nauphoetae]